MGTCNARPAIDDSGVTTWTVCDPDGLPVEVIDEYLQWLRSRLCSVNTVKSYSHHLAALFTWFELNQIDWDRAEYSSVTDFVLAYRGGSSPFPKRGGGERSVATLRAASAAIREFYEYQRIETGRGPENLRLTRMISRRGGNANPNHFLAHVERNRESVPVNRLSWGMRGPAKQIQIINFESDFKLLLAACNNRRDRLALSAFYDLGLRIGQACGLQHGDLDPRRRRVTISRRDDNPNGALSKQRDTFEVHDGLNRFFDLYRDYLLRDVIPAGIDSNFVFVNAYRSPIGNAVSYSNMYQQVEAIGSRAGLGRLTPHMLRHTHGTALAKAGWTSAEIAARLGQSNPASAGVYIHLASEDLENRLAETKHLVWAGTAEREDPR